MALIPGWNSIAGAHWWSNFYFWASIGALIWLGASEIISHRYSERKDELSAIEQDAIKKAHDEEMARLHVEAARLSAEAEAARNQIAEANARASEAQLELAKFKEPRTINANPDTELVKKLSEFAGTRVDIFSELSVSDAYFFGNGIWIAFHNAKWDARSRNVIGSFPIKGVAISSASGDVPPSMKWFDLMDKLIEIFRAANVDARRGMPFRRDGDAAMLGSIISGPAWDPNDVAPIRIVIGPKP